MKGDFQWHALKVGSPLLKVVSGSLLCSFESNHSMLVWVI